MTPAPAKSPAPTPPDWASFTIDEDSRYADGDQDAATLAEISARELAGYLFTARLLEIARREGRNPLVREARAFTPKQLEELDAGIREARRMAEWMLEECSCAFGCDGAGRIREYVEKSLEAEIEFTPEPRQQNLF